jgi:hypothetical protein
MLLIVDGEGFFFKSFGIRWAKTDSERFLMSKDYMKKGIIVAISALVIMAIINVVPAMADEGVDTTKDVLIEGHPIAPEFASQDAFGITGISAISVTSHDGVKLNVYILHKEDYESGNWANRLNIYRGDSEDVVNLTYERDTYLPFDDYVLYINSKNQTANVTYTLHRDISQQIVLYLTVFSGLFAMLNAVWAIYLLPMKKKYEKTSIYE